ncbi:hypothetical protein Adu01nite_38470 [Paractinoplanes durhamensis]|uniref:Uncharacterized protein n=1 Tax=Paractinoplanes durhamensis TaxID=113563 RepID=A0ABQ3YY52_9ACTN|nr:hypothetical protein Adu01nite_38470 [Actinoplanes durhamensis]
MVSQKRNDTKNKRGKEHNNGDGGAEPQPPVGPGPVQNKPHQTDRNNHQPEQGKPTPAPTPPPISHSRGFFTRSSHESVVN